MTKTNVRIILELHKANTYSYWGRLHMKTFIHNNMHIVLLAIISIILIAIVYVTDENVEQQQITIVQGDTLWTLSDLYRGKMSTEDWIAEVKQTNYLQTDHILVGEQLVIPVEETSYYVAYKKVEQYEQNIEVASDMK